MFNFSSGGLDFGEGIGGTKRRQYLMIGGLVLLIGGSLAFTIWYLFMPPSTMVVLPKEYHMFCVNCNKEVIIPSEQAVLPPAAGASAGTSGGPATGPAGAPPGGPTGGSPGGPPGGSPVGPSGSPPGQQKAVCPVCGKAGLVPEKKCPKCKHYYITDWDKTHGPMEIDPQLDTIKCPDCGVNIEEYRKSHPNEG